MTVGDTRGTVLYHALLTLNCQEGKMSKEASEPSLTRLPSSKG